MTPSDAGVQEGRGDDGRIEENVSFAKTCVNICVFKDFGKILVNLKEKTSIIV